ncbi:hypothetical protein TNCV_4718511 [Trichonephila clavipes]|nr:hypothetical protein TNCV_4718511 [Trichonephila clavipes]
MLLLAAFSENREFRTICQLATCDDCRPCIGLDLLPYAIITHSVKWRQSVEPVCAIIIHTHLFVSGLNEYLGLLLHKGPRPQKVLIRPCRLRVFQHDHVAGELSRHGRRFFYRVVSSSPDASKT